MQPGKTRNIPENGAKEPVLLDEAAAVEGEVRQRFHLSSLDIPHHGPPLPVQRRIHDAWGICETCLQIGHNQLFVEIPREQRDVVVEQGRRAEDLAGSVVPQHAEIAAMAIGVGDNRIEHCHGFEVLDRLVTKLGKVGQGQLKIAQLGEIGGKAQLKGHESRIAVIEQLAGGAELPLPFGELVGHRVNAGRASHLPGQLLRIGLAAVIGRR